jgi:hypothetical protein
MNFESIYKLSEKEDWKEPELQSLEDYIGGAMKKRSTTVAKDGFSDYGKGPKGEILKIIASMSAKTIKVVQAAYNDGYSDYVSNDSPTKVINLFRDVKMGRKTAEEAAEEIIGKVGSFENARVNPKIDWDDSSEFWTGAMDNERGTYWNSGQIGNSNFRGGLKKIISNIGLFVKNRLIDLTKVVTIPRDAIKTAEMIIKDSYNVKGIDVNNFVNKMKVIAAGLFQAAVKVDAGKDPLTEAYKNYMLRI